MLRKIAVLLCFILLCKPFYAVGQTETSVKKRPTVGIVLSGGGARGFAHIGVLKVLEENRIPVDYIGGASMGGLIGALYAMGHSPEEMEELISELDWNKLLEPIASLEKLSFRRKEDRRNIPAPVNLKGKITDLKLPNALNSGHEIGILFDRLTLPYSSVKEFENLPIPFRTVGTDMLNGGSVTLRSGSLSRSLRATMSIPGMFSPVEIDGKILSDGGLVNNIPTDIVKDMGADIILVVNIETQLNGRESLESLPGVLQQTINVATVDNSRRSLRQADMIIAPDLQEKSLMDFSDSKAIIELGKKGAEEKLQLLGSLSLSETEWQEHLQHRNSRKLAPATQQPTFIAVAGNDANVERIITERLADKFTNKPLDETQLDELAKDLTALTGTGRFDALHYELTERNGEQGLIIESAKLGDEPTTPSRLEIGVNLNTGEADNVNFNLLARLTLYDIGRFGAELRNDVRLGSNTYFASEYYRPLGYKNFFIAPKASYETRRENIFNDNNRIAEYVYHDVRAGVDLGYSFNPRTELRAGYTIGRQQITRRIGDPLLMDIKGKFSVAGLKFTYDRVDKAQVPTHGLYSQTSLDHYFSSPGTDGDLTQAKTTFNIFHSLSDRNIVFGIGGAGFTTGSDPSVIQQFALGGPLKISGYGYNEFRAKNFFNGGIGLLHNPQFMPGFLGGKIYLGGWYEGGSAFNSSQDLNYRQSVTLGSVIETPFGPFFIGSSITENGRNRFYFSYGKFF